MKLYEIARPGEQKLLRKVALHFTSVAPTKFKPRDGGGIESGDWGLANNVIVGKHIEIYIPHHDRDFDVVTVNAHGGPDFLDAVNKKISEWHNVLHFGGGTFGSTGADLGYFDDSK